MYPGRNVLPYPLQHASISRVILKWKQHIHLKDHYMAIRLHDITSQQTVIFLSEFSVWDLTLFSLRVPLLSRSLSCQCGGKKWQEIRTIQNKQFSWRPTTIPEIWQICVVRITPGCLLWQAYFYVPVGKWEVGHPRLRWKDQLISLAMGLRGPVLLWKIKKRMHHIVYSWNETIVRCSTFLLFITPIKPNKIKTIQIWL
jgi:hypothetical protein